METESCDDNKSDPSNDYPDPSDDYTADNPMSSDLASQLLSVAIYEREHLKLRLSELEKKIRSYREIILPISQLPEDTLREIFVRCITDQDASLQPTSTRRLPKPVPICLAQVCSSWRSIAMSMPALWSTLYVRFHPDRVDHVRITCAQAHEWLARSGTLPLTILVDTSLDREDDNDIILFIKSLIQYSHRCRILRFACPHTWLKSWTSVGPADVPILRSFEHRPSFHWQIGAPGEYALWSSLKLLSAPSLRELSLIIPHIPPKYSMPRVLPLEHVSFTTLTQLHLRTGHASLVEMWHILNCCRQLEQCLLAPGRQNPTNGASIPEGSTLILPNLTTLRLHDTRASLNEVPEFFSQLDLPSLDSFQLYTTASAPWAKMEYCLRVTDLDLCIGSFNLDNDTLCDLLRGNHFIRRLRLDTSQSSKDVLPYLFPDPDTPDKMLCPQLETLEIDKVSWSAPNLITLLTTRVRLRQVFLDIDDVDMTLLRKLEDLESTLPVRVRIIYKALKCYRPWYYCVHERLVQSPRWPLSEWELTGGTL